MTKADSSELQSETNDHTCHTCQYCDKSFKWIYQLRTHLKDQHDTTFLQCKLCEKYTATKSAMEGHMDYVHFRKNLYLISI